MAATASTFPAITATHCGYFCHTITTTTDVRYYSYYFFDNDKYKCITPHLRLSTAPSHQILLSNCSFRIVGRVRFVRTCQDTQSILTPSSSEHVLITHNHEVGSGSYNMEQTCPKCVQMYDQTCKTNPGGKGGVARGSRKNSTWRQLSCHTIHRS